MLYPQDLKAEQKNNNAAKRKRRKIEKMHLQFSSTLKPAKYCDQFSVKQLG